MRILFVLFATLAARESHGAQEPKFALLNGTEVVLLDGEAKELAKFTADTRPKVDLRWSPGGQRLSYKVRPDAGAKGRVVIIDLQGKILKEISIQPVTDPPTFQFRYIDSIDWLTGHTLRVKGNINNWNCGFVDIDVDSGSEISGLITGQCRAFTDSPDGKHVAYIGTGGGPDEERDESPEVDSKIQYRLPGTVLNIVADPVWSEDSTRMAFVYKLARTGDAALGLLTLNGVSSHVLLPKQFSKEASLTWLGNDVAVHAEKEIVVVNSRQKRIVPVSLAMIARLKQEESEQRKNAETERRIQDVRKQYGATECVALPE